MKRWRFRAAAPDAGDVRKTAARLGVPPLIVRLLRQRGLADVAEMDAFLSPNLRHLAAPDLWPGMARAAETLEKAALEGKTIVILSLIHISEPTRR